MNRSWILMIGLLIVVPAQAVDAKPTVMVYLEWERSVTPSVVYRATHLASQIFASVGMRVEFHDPHNRRNDGQTGLELKLKVEAQTPSGVEPGVLALSFPFRADGGIRVFYPKVQNYKPAECRPPVLAYMMVHEIAHVLEGMQYHSRTGIMKMKWEGRDFGEIHKLKLAFEPDDVELMRAGIERRRAGMFGNVQSGVAGNLTWH